MASPEFKVGDRVRVRDGANSSFVGVHGVVTKVRGVDYPLPVTVRLANRVEGVNFGAHELEHVTTSDVVADKVRHPHHYLQHPSGIEIIDITRHHSFCIGNALKYLFRHEHKGQPVEDLRKAIAYIEFAIEDLERDTPKSV